MTSAPPCPCLKAYSKSQGGDSPEAAPSEPVWIHGSRLFLHRSCGHTYMGQDTPTTEQTRLPPAHTRWGPCLCSQDPRPNSPLQGNQTEQKLKLKRSHYQHSKQPQHAQVAISPGQGAQALPLLYCCQCPHTKRPKPTPQAGPQHSPMPGRRSQGPTSEAPGCCQQCHHNVLPDLMCTSVPGTRHPPEAPRGRGGKEARLATQPAWGGQGTDTG